MYKKMNKRNNEIFKVYQNFVDNKKKLKRGMIRSKREGESFASLKRKDEERYALYMPRKPRKRRTPKKSFQAFQVLRRRKNNYTVCEKEVRKNNLVSFSNF